ncbi:MAG TPA: lytic murein transglycosylase [Nocardioides sp.]|uniref:lytic transglycosylase domain-containing protein n=1 Tax=Nocardioides sp. TaxID=35761 RepID=UPI002E346AA7|nr:lytic murein transglycosylase [Nocardioides sp.]HEX3931124.1 lytic murein transglycosylase [Nocardioides sp.]
MTSRVRARLHGLRRGPVRAALSSGVVAVLAAALVTGGRDPSTQMLATADGAPTGQTAGAAQAPATVPPVELPHPSGQAVRAPASASRPDPSGLPDVQGVPAVALTAYQRAAAVIDAADPSCRLDWATLAAIGDVESDHGQVGGSSLSSDGIAHPAIVGPRLDGKHGTSLVRDTDAGRLDGDSRYDRAVGPMQFLPSTWAAVAVDGDGDGRRDVQDINDAALGSAVYLCADHDDLSTRAGQRAALMRYNHSRAYVDRVMAIAHAYLASGLLPTGDMSARPVTFIEPGRDESGRPHGKPHGRHHRHHHPGGPGPVTTDPVPPTPVPPTPTPPPTAPPTSPPTNPPSDPPTDPPTSPGGPSDPPDPTAPTEPPIIPTPLPSELADFSPAQIQAYDQAWAACDDDLVAGWSSDPDQVATLTQCLADEVDVPIDDPDLLVFVTWVAGYEDPSPSDAPSTSPSDDPPDSPTDTPTDAPTG